MLSKDEEKFSWIDLFRAFRYLIGDRWNKNLAYLIPLFVVSFYTVIPPLVIGKIVDFFSSYKVGNSHSPFYFYAIFLGGSFSLVSFIRLTLKRYLGNLKTDIVYDINVKGFDRLLSLSWMDSRKEVAGEKAQKLSNGTQAFYTLSSQINDEIFQSLGATIGIGIIFAYLNYYYLIFLMFYILGFFLIVRFYYSRIQQVKNDYSKASEKGSGAYVEGLGNILTIKTLGAKESFNQRIASKEGIKKKFDYLGRKYGIGQWIAFQVFNGICVTAYLLLVGRDVLTGAISLGSIVIFYGYLEKLTGNASNLLGVYEQIISAKISIARMMPIFWTSHESTTATANFPKKWDQITLRDATFDYNLDLPTTQVVGLQKINFSIKHNEHVGVIGETGSGKSTFAKLLVGIFPLNSGEFKIDDLNFYDIHTDEISDNISLVLQDTEVFDLSLRENITMMRKLDLESLELAIEISHLGDVIAKLPNGLDTLLGEKGYRLSGGERQRIGIARAIYRNPQIFVFDEATSSLDVQTEKIIRQNIETKLGAKTTIWITHRLATLEGCNQIYSFNKGALSNLGNYKQMMKNS